MILIEHIEYSHLKGLASSNIHDRIDHWIQWFHVLQEEHFFYEPYVVLELMVHDNEHVELHFYFKLARDVVHFI